MAKSSRSRRPTLRRVVQIAVVPVVVVLSVGLSLLSRSCRTGESSLVEAYLFEDEGRAWLTVVESRFIRGGRGGGSVSYYQMTVIEPSTGTVVATTELTERERSPRFRGFRRVDHRLWTDSDLGIRLFDLRTATPLWTQEELVARVPELAAGFQIANETFNDYSPPTAGLPLVLADGRRAWLDMSPAVKFEPVPTDPWRPGYFCGPDNGAKPSCERKECIAFDSVQGSTGMVLGVAPVWQESDMVTVDSSADADGISSAEAPKPFLRPGLVRLHETECAVELSDGDVLVLHDSSAVDPKEPLLTRAERSGGRVWTTPVASMLPPEHEFQALPEPYEAQQTADGLTLLLSERGNHDSLTVVVLDP